MGLETFLKQSRLIGRNIRFFRHRPTEDKESSPTLCKVLKVMETSLKIQMRGTGAVEVIPFDQMQSDARDNKDIDIQILAY